MKYFFFIAIFFIVTSACAFPNKPITIYVPFSSGGASETLVNILVNQLVEDTDIKFVVKSNDKALSATEYLNSLVSLPNDGYHLIFGNVGTHASNIELNKNAVLYDPLNDFIPIVLIGKTPMFLVIRSDFPANNFDEFIEYLQDNKSKLITFAHSGYGSTSYLASIYLCSILKITPMLISYSGSSTALKDIAYGYVDMMVNQSTSSLSFLKGGLVKSFFTTTDKRSELLPNIPTTKEIGIPEFDIQGWNMIFVPKGTAPEKVQFLNNLFLNMLKNKFVRNELKLSDTIIIPEEDNNVIALQNFVRSQLIYWQNIISVLKKIERQNIE